MPLPNPVIFVPGVTATDLRDLYSIPPDKVWSLLTHEYECVGLHPEDLRYEAQQPAQIRPDQIFEIAYKEMVLDLRHDLSPTADRPVPVYLFGYDWRQPLEVIQARLKAFIAEVIDKTALTRHYAADGYAARRRINLVGHSMGGLVITGYLADEGPAAPVDRVATLATPFKGSFDAVEKIVLGTTNRREREAARLTPSLYYLIPTVTQGITIDAGLPQTDMFDPRLWQSNVLETLAEAVRLHGADPDIAKDTVAARAARARKAVEVLDTLLGQAKTHRHKVDTFNPADCGLTAANWLCVMGVGDKTRIKLKISDTQAGPIFDLSSQMVSDDRILRPPAWETGDGTVPLAAAQPNFAVTSQIVSREDWGLLEFKDKLLDVAAALHGILPNMNKVQTMLRNHLA
jgi:pimeloyl-ACP methyl ester carboxylesterase